MTARLLEEGWGDESSCNVLVSSPDRSGKMCQSVPICKTKQSKYVMASLAIAWTCKQVEGEMELVLPEENNNVST